MGSQCSTLSDMIDVFEAIDTQLLTQNYPSVFTFSLYSFHWIYHPLFCVSEHFSRIWLQPLQIAGANYSWHKIGLIKNRFSQRFCLHPLSLSLRGKSRAGKTKKWIIPTLTCLAFCAPLSLASPLLHYRREQKIVFASIPHRQYFFESLMNGSDWIFMAAEPWQQKNKRHSKQPTFPCTNP